MENKYYMVYEDLQGGYFGKYCLMDIDGWHEQAIIWAELDDWNENEIAELVNLDKKEIMEYISDTWTLDFIEIDKCLVDVIGKLLFYEMEKEIDVILDFLRKEELKWKN